MSEQFYSRDEEGNFETHKTEAEARRDAEEILENCQEAASDDGWPEGTCYIEWGRLVPLGECVASNERESDRSDFDYLVDYNLKDLPDPTAALESVLEAAQRRITELEKAALALSTAIRESVLAETTIDGVDIERRVPFCDIEHELAELESLLASSCQPTLLEVIDEHD